MADRLAWTTADMTDQTGRTAVVTGANSGLGLCSAEALAGHGARVVLACRDRDRGRSALERVRAAATAADPALVALDLADLGSVAAAADELASSLDRIDILMNNAGVMAVPLRRTPDGFESQFGTNHLGHFALTGRLLPVLAAAGAPRVVTTSSTAHRIGTIHWDDLHWERRYRKWSAYGQSKLANLLFAFELDRRARAHRLPLVSVAAHPGYAATHLQAAGPELSGSRFMLRANELANRVFAQSAEMGALPQLYAATVDGVAGGSYIGPDGYLETRGHPRPVRAKAAAYDFDAARRLWELSEELTDVHYVWPAPARDR